MSGSESPTMFSYVYVLQSQQNYDLYIGRTTAIKKRFAEYQKGQSKYTSGYRPWELVYFEAHRDKIDAKRRENYLKTTLGNRSLKRMLRNQLNRGSTT